MKPLLTLLLALCLAHTARATPDAQAILAASDAVRNPGFAFSLSNTLTEYRKGKQSDSSTLVVYSRASASDGQFRSLVRYQAPARDVGKLILYNGRDLWFYDPASKASVRLSPQQRLLGQASNGDVVTTNFAHDYRATQALAEDTLDGDRQPRASYKLLLEASGDGANYPRIEMWVSQDGARPIKARFYADSGKLLKTAYYRRYQRWLGVERPTETVIIDGLEPDWITVMRYSDWVKREVPEAWLQRDYLPRFQPE